jgi:hypothetical protein
MLLTTILAGAILVSAPAAPPAAEGRHGVRLGLLDLTDVPALPPAIERTPTMSRSLLQRREQKPPGLLPALPADFRLAGVPAESAGRLLRPRRQAAPRSPRAPPSPLDTFGLAPVPPT